ncbi:MAG: SMC-Scp complex subunit ScpB [Lachnospiraceae bacterium]|nr:SMC-Scp complex subunit ScpB [Lachnospiraceae bacterium]
MDIKKLMAVVEAILFTLGKQVEIKKIAEAAETDVEEVLKAAERLEKKYAAEDSGVMLIRINDSLQLCTKTEFYDYLVKIAHVKKQFTLSDSALETLSIIAYKQPVTRLQIEHIRGVSCAHSIDKLLEYDLIQELGRLNAPGRPLLFGTTDEFLRSFGVKSLEELPELNEDRMEDFREEAEIEARKEMEELGLLDENGPGSSPDNPISVGI